MIGENIKRILAEIPAGVSVIAATKQRSVEEIEEAIACGITIVGENYIQEAERKFDSISGKVRWHLIGHLQSNKVRKALDIFDCIQTLDTLKLASRLNAELEASGKTISVLIEINSGSEPQKAGVLPDTTVRFVEEAHAFKRVQICGLMTMGPACERPENLRPCFRRVRLLYEELKRSSPAGTTMEILSMGMSDSYRVAIDEGANLVRIGTAIFGPRNQ